MRFYVLSGLLRSCFIATAIAVLVRSDPRMNAWDWPGLAILYSTLMIPPVGFWVPTTVYLTLASGLPRSDPRLRWAWLAAVVAVGLFGGLAFNATSRGIGDAG